MPPKKKKKAPAICTDESALLPFGFKLYDIVRTPLGLIGTVIGVKFENPELRETGRVIVRYSSGQESPLEPKLSSGYMYDLGYRRCPEADHIRRDVESHQTKQKELDKQRAVIAEILYCKENGLPIPPSLLPKAKEKKKKKESGKKKK